MWMSVHPSAGREEREALDCVEKKKGRKKIHIPAGLADDSAGADDGSGDDARAVGDGQGLRLSLLVSDVLRGFCVILAFATGRRIGDH